MMLRPAGLPPSLAKLERTAVMGICNVTDDSFSEAGRHFDADAAVGHALAMLAAGADLVDVGGESTRPGAGRVDPAEELRRVVPVVKRLVKAGAAVSVDTVRASVALASVQAGACLINDVSGGLADAAMYKTMAETAVPCVLTHWRGPSDQMDSRDLYTDPATQVASELGARLVAATQAGVDPARVVLDPGLGFAKVGPTNWRVLAGLDSIAALGRPLLLGGSRKRFLGPALGAHNSAGNSGQWERYDGATAALSALAARAGLWCVRVHHVAPNLDAVRVGNGWRTGALER